MTPRAIRDGGGRSNRRHFSSGEKRFILAEVDALGVTVTAMAIIQQSDLYATDKPQAEHSNLAKLLENIEREHRGDADKDGTNGKADAGDKTASRRQGNGPIAEREAPADGRGASASSSSLWGQVEPCWRRMPNESSVPVTLRFRLNGSGLIDKPPVIVRPNGSAPDQARLIAEARAIAAISACLRYNTVEGSNPAPGYVVDLGAGGRKR